MPKHIYMSSALKNGNIIPSITTYLGEMLSMAEEKYGDRDKSFTILGIELFKSSIPHIFFPWYNQASKYIVIRITRSCRNDMNQALFQTSHEVIHCLSPVVNLRANILEEGLATHFSLEFTNSHGIQMHVNDQRYLVAKALIDNLLGYDADIIKKIRQVQPVISSIQPRDILQINPAIPQPLATELCQVF